MSLQPRASARNLEHRPEKWTAVFGQADAAQHFTASERVGDLVRCCRWRYWKSRGAGLFGQTDFSSLVYDLAAPTEAAKLEFTPLRQVGERDRGASRVSDVYRRFDARVTFKRDDGGGETFRIVGLASKIRWRRGLIGMVRIAGWMTNGGSLEAFKW